MHSTSDTRYISSSVRGAFQLVHHERFRPTSNRVEERTKGIGRFNFFLWFAQTTASFIEHLVEC